MGLRYLLQNVRTGAVLGEIPFQESTWSEVYNMPGSFSGKLPLDLPERVVQWLEPILGEADPELAGLAVYPEYDGEILDGYILWTADIKISDGGITLAGEGLHSYYRRRTLKADLTYTAQDQATVMGALIAWAEANPAGQGIGVVYSPGSTGVTITRKYKSSENRQIGQIIEDESEIDPDFNFRYDSRWYGGVIQNRFIVRKEVGATTFVFEVGKQILDGDLKIDGTQLVTRVDAIGAGEGTGAIRANVSDTTRYTKMPALDDIAEHTDVKNTTDLTAYANARLKEGSKPIVLPKVTVNPRAEPRLGTYHPGDLVRFRMTSGIIGLDKQFYITEIACTADANGNVTADVSFSNVEVRPKLRPHSTDTKKYVSKQYRTSKYHIPQLPYSTIEDPTTGTTLWDPQNGNFGGSGGGSLTWNETTLDSPWSDVGGNYPDLEYAKDGFNIVHLRGWVAINEISWSGAANAGITTLPAGFVPARAGNEGFSCYLDENAIGLARPALIRIYSDGVVYIVGITAGSGALLSAVISLSGITFQA